MMGRDTNEKDLFKGENFVTENLLACFTFIESKEQLVWMGLLFAIFAWDVKRFEVLVKECQQWISG